MKKQFKNRFSKKRLQRSCFSFSSLSLHMIALCYNQPHAWWSCRILVSHSGFFRPLVPMRYSQTVFLYTRSSILLRCLYLSMRLTFISTSILVLRCAFKIINISGRQRVNNTDINIASWETLPADTVRTRRRYELWKHALTPSWQTTVRLDTGGKSIQPFSRYALRLLYR